MEFLLSIKILDYQVIFVPWNIFLALLPCWTAYFMWENLSKKEFKNLSFFSWIIFTFSFLFWLFFIPNTAYLFSASRHLINYCVNPGMSNVCEYQFYVVPLFFIYSLIGIPTFIYALRKMSLILGKLFHPILTKIFPIIMSPIIVIGILLGLFERFNSWDVLYDPLFIIRIAIEYFTKPHMVLHFIIYTLALYFVYYVFPLLLSSKPTLSSSRRRGSTKISNI